MRALAPLLCLALAACVATPATAPETTKAGSFVEVERIAVNGLPDQRLTIWLPPGYEQSEQRYPVVYMHDGHNLFDLEKSNFQKIWAADKAMLEVMKSGAVEPHIIVGIWAPGEDRYRQYLPQFAAAQATGGIAASIRKNALDRPIVSARYLDWIVNELKPRIDAEYRTRSARGDTTIIGSSMGGIMSCYAILARPEVFGQAGCVSSHWPIALPEEAEADPEQVIAIWQDWLDKNLGDPDGRRIWMDHGTATLDQYYAPYQQAIDTAFREAGWEEGTDFRTEVYDGAEHDEIAWAQRLPEMLTWLLSER